MTRSDLIIADWPAPKQIRALTTTRKLWGHSYQAENTSILATTLSDCIGAPAIPHLLKQTHSTTVIPLDKTNQHPATGDAAFTANKNTVCTIVTADCLPIFICEGNGQQVAAIHAGWRGLANGIIETTLTQFQAYKASDLLVWLGPAISRQHFEVGIDVYQAFTGNNSHAKQCFIAQGEQKWLADLYALATLILNQQGISAIFGGNFCTYAQNDLFFSYRRDGAHTGRMASCIWIAH